MTIEKRGNKWRIREMRKGRRISILLDHKPSKTEARDLVEAKFNIYVTPTGEATVDTALCSYIDARRVTRSPATIREYVRIAKSLDLNLLDTRLSDISKYDLQDYIDSMVLKGLSPKTIRNRIEFVLSAIRELRPELAFNLSYPQPKKENFYVPEDSDVKKLVELLHGTEYEIPVLLSAYGMRRSEIFALTLDDIGDGEIRIQKATVQDEYSNWVVKSTKTTMSTRTITVPVWITDMIRAKGHICTLSPGAISRYIKKIQRQNGMPEFSLHKLRHYYASAAAAQHVPAAVIKANGGWATDHVMNRVYTHAQKESIKKESDLYNAHFNELLKHS